MTIRIRGIEFEDNLDNSMGVEFHNLSHRYGFQCPNWPYFRDVQIERMHYTKGAGGFEAGRHSKPPQTVKSATADPELFIRPAVEFGLQRSIDQSFRRIRAGIICKTLSLDHAT